MNRIKIVLKEEGKTSQWLANEIGVDKSTVSRWCTNDMQPTIPRLFDIAKALNISVRVLLTENLIDID